jgi:uncharacterized membrane protein
MDLWQLLGDLHPKLVHFPLVLLPAGLIFDLVGLLAPRGGRAERAHWAGRALTVCGTVMLLLGFISGIYAEIWAGRAMVPHRQIELHELAANVASWGFVVLAAWRLLMDPARRGVVALYVVVGLGWYLLLVITAYLGGQLVTDYGAGVTGARALAAATLHDLNTLATRQTDLNLRYSEMMHHIFGWLTLALSGSLLAAALFPKRAGQLGWIAPGLLLLGGVFLFLFADLDLYRLTDVRQWRDREVQLHKTIALALTVVGVVGLRKWRRRRRRGARESTPASSAGAAPVAASGPSLQARLIAVMALVGGGMLFTHVHTVAPYANVAAGVYVAHVVMGMTALAIGASSLLADAYPHGRRAFNLVFAVCMCVESVLLLTYNEGLPWYIGYGRYDRWGPNGGTVAPYGDVRAELCFDNDTQALDVRVLDRFKNEPAAVAARSVELLVARGYQETAVTLNAKDGATGHFTATAPFLKDAPAFSARMALPVGASGRMKMGYFDPWVAPVIAAVPPNEVARFVCPMHGGIRAEGAGACRLCGMPMAPVETAAQRATLHDANYEMVLAAAPRESSLAVSLQLTPKRDGQVLRDLARVHEYRLHLMIVSDDLSFFDHVHPKETAEGSFELAYTFPRAGAYLLFADVTPVGARGQVFRMPLTVGGGAETKRAMLVASAGGARVLGSDPTVTVEMIPTPRRLSAGSHAQLLFRVSRGARPVTDLQPYLGAMGHCVIISEDTQAYLHCHPEQLFTPRADARGGPDVAFGTRFAKAGRYKVWGQFRRGDQILVADFVVDVSEPPLPAWLTAFLLDD